MTISGQDYGIVNIVIIQMLQGSVPAGDVSLQPELVPSNSLGKQMADMTYILGIKIDRMFVIEIGARKHDLVDYETPCGTSVFGFAQCPVKPVLLSRTHHGTAWVVCNGRDVVSIVICRA